MLTRPAGGNQGCSIPPRSACSVHGSDQLLDRPDRHRCARRIFGHRCRLSLPGSRWRPSVSTAVCRCEYKTANIEVDIGLFTDGRLAHVMGRESSGIAVYDAGAVKAIKAASPFPPVPRALMAKAKPGSARVRRPTGDRLPYRAPGGRVRRGTSAVADDPRPRNPE
ncbi:MAG: hypothetical protein DME07_15385 [Candidatus Rokuibacteriota bacterium]|nr:MAG: hypothetical protein DME07_15385 [Candidatus Rokubacteria bacterium]